jgi:hypothetical protein
VIEGMCTAGGRETECRNGPFRLSTRYEVRECPDFPAVTPLERAASISERSTGTVLYRLIRTLANKWRPAKRA